MQSITTSAHTFCFSEMVSRPAKLVVDDDGYYIVKIIYEPCKHKMAYISQYIFAGELWHHFSSSLSKFDFGDACCLAVLPTGDFVARITNVVGIRSVLMAGPLLFA